MELKNKLLTRIKQINQKIKESGDKTVPLDIRLFLQLSVLVLTIIAGVVAILFITGTFTAGLDESQHLVENELDHAASAITQQYGELSVQAIDFSLELSRSIEAKTNQKGIPLSDLEQHPEILEEIISGEFDRAMFTLQRAKSSGVFFILNATINPALANAENSRAGLYIKNMEPNIINSSSPNIIVFRGIPKIGRDHALSLHTQWKMEFDISDASYYHRPFQAGAIHTDLPLSRLYYWNPVTLLPDSSEEAMLCSVPLIDSRGNVFGVCGIEISTMLFKLTNMPDSDPFKRLFCVLSPVNENTLDLQHSMFAGGYSAKIISKGHDRLNISKERRSFYSYSHQDHSFLGVHKPVQLYPQGSAFENEKWVAAVMIPKDDIVTSLTRLNLMLIALLMLLVVLGVLVSLILSRKFLQPITQGLDMIKTTDLSNAPSTKIAEIDDLIKYLSEHNQELSERAQQENLSINLLDEFLAKIKELSPAERAVFDLYVEGHTAKEAAEKLCLSINTIKTHNKKIYMKLNVASRDELLLYISMLKEIGAEIE